MHQRESFPELLCERPALVENQNALGNQFVNDGKGVMTASPLERVLSCNCPEPLLLFFYFSVVTKTTVQRWRRFASLQIFAVDQCLLRIEGEGDWEHCESRVTWDFISLYTLGGAGSLLLVFFATSRILESVSGNHFRARRCEEERPTVEAVTQPRRTHSLFWNTTSRRIESRFQLRRSLLETRYFIYIGVVGLSNNQYSKWLGLWVCLSGGGTFPTLSLRVLFGKLFASSRYQLNKEQPGRCMLGKRERWVSTGQDLLGK